jgi:hypothetical protein
VSIPAVDYTYFSSIFPELAAIPSTVVDALNPVGLNYVSEATYGTSSQYALALAIAHLYALGFSKGAGQITGDRVGDISQQNVALEQKKGSMGMTTYGLRLRELGRMLKPGGIFVGGGPPQQLPPPFGGFQPTWQRGGWF